VEAVIFREGLPGGLLPQVYWQKKGSRISQYRCKTYFRGGNDDIEKAIKEAIASNDTIGGIIECRVKILQLQSANLSFIHLNLH